jgi:hypothetical protein
MKDSCGCRGNIPRPPPSSPPEGEQLGNCIFRWEANCNNRRTHIFLRRFTDSHTAVVDSSSQIPSFRWWGGPVSKLIRGLGTNKNVVMGPQTKNDCAGEGRQQITTLPSLSWYPKDSEMSHLDVFLVLIVDCFQRNLKHYYFCGASWLFI